MEKEENKPNPDNQDTVEPDVPKVEADQLKELNIKVIDKKK